jgi:hypothetical protein
MQDCVGPLSFRMREALGLQRFADQSQGAEPNIYKLSTAVKHSEAAGFSHLFRGLLLFKTAISPKYKPAGRVYYGQGNRDRPTRVRSLFSSAASLQPLKNGIVSAAISVFPNCVTSYCGHRFFTYQTYPRTPHRDSTG